MPNDKPTQTTMGSLAWEYRGEGLYIYYENPWDKNLKTDLVMFMWPCHDIEATSDVEQTYEKLAQVFCAAWNDRLLKKAAVEESVMMYHQPPGFKL